MKEVYWSESPIQRAADGGTGSIVPQDGEPFYRIHNYHVMPPFLVSLVSLFFVRLPLHSFSHILLFALLTSFVFSLAGMINGIFAKKFDDISIIPTFVLTPLTYLGGVFYSISLLPDFWQMISKANPIIYMIDGFRYGFLGIADMSVMTGLGMLIFFAVVLFSINIYLLKKGIGIRT